MVEKLAALKAGPNYRFFGNDNPKCPHCGDDFDIATNEAWFLHDEQDTHTIECRRCENEFQVNATARWSFSTDEQEASNADA